MSNRPASTPEPPYFAVVFTSNRPVDGDADDYGEIGARMVELAAGMSGFLGVESVRGADGFGITVSYWESEAAIAAWKRHAEHLVAQREGRARFYERYALRVCRVERASSFERPPSADR